MDSELNIPAPLPDDPWLTVGEFADATRVKPVTVRSWIAKGQLKATRSGKRKWLIRSSELSRMLNDGEWVDEFDLVPPVSDGEDEYPEMDLRTRLEFERIDAVRDWELMLERSRMAPPDADFANRLRGVCQAAAWWATALKDRVSDDPEFMWDPVAGSVGMVLSYELRPGGNRPGPRDAWERFDRTVVRLGQAMEGDRLSAVTGALTDLAAAGRDIADTLDNRSKGELKNGA